MIFCETLSLNVCFGAFGRGCVKSLSPPTAAEFCIETTLDSLILRSKINESSVVSNYFSARSAEKNLFTQYSAAEGGKSPLHIKSMMSEPQNIATFANGCTINRLVAMDYRGGKNELFFVHAKAF